MTRRRERKRPPIVSKYDSHKSYVAIAKVETKDALIQYLYSWLEFDYEQRSIIHNGRRVFTVFDFSKSSVDPLKIIVLRRGGLQILNSWCRGHNRDEEECESWLGHAFKRNLPDEYDAWLKYYVVDIAHFLVINANKGIDGDQAACILLRVEYYTSQTILEYLSDITVSKTDPSVRKFLIFG